MSQSSDLLFVYLLSFFKIIFYFTVLLSLIFFPARLTACPTVITFNCLVFHLALCVCSCVCVHCLLPLDFVSSSVFPGRFPSLVNHLHAFYDPWRKFFSCLSLLLLLFYVYFLDDLFWIVLNLPLSFVYQFFIKTCFCCLLYCFLLFSPLSWTCKHNTEEFTPVQLQEHRGFHTQILTDNRSLNQQLEQLELRSDHCARQFHRAWQCKVEWNWINTSTQHFQGFKTSIPPFSQMLPAIQD